MSSHDDPSRERTDQAHAPEDTRRARPLRVYLAGSSGEIRRARTAYELLAALPNVVVVSTWLDVIEKVGIANPSDASAAQRREWTVTDLAEVASADAVWFLVPSSSAPTRGAWAELGYAYALSKRILCSGATRQSIFCALGSEHAMDEGALEAIEAIAVGFIA